jgi:hypothetical protein
MITSFCLVRYFLPGRDHSRHPMFIYWYNQSIRSRSIAIPFETKAGNGRQGRQDEDPIAPFLITLNTLKTLPLDSEVKCLDSCKMLQVGRARAVNVEESRKTLEAGMLDRLNGVIGYSSALPALPSMHAPSRRISSAFGDYSANEVFPDWRG